MQVFVILISVFMLIGAANGKSVEVDTINDAQWAASAPSKKAISPLLIKTEALLARANFSSGEISGKPSENLNKAIAAFAEAQGKATDKLDQQLWDKLSSMSDDPIVVDYTISEEDVRGPSLEKIPNKMERMKDLPHLSYTSAKEKLVEKFHMSPESLSALNPDEKFESAGRTIMMLFRQQFRRDLRGGRFRMEFAQSGDLALQRITEATGVSLILILSDINMPGMTGLELLPKAKAARPDVPVIMITAYGHAETKRKALEGGAEALFTKPISIRALHVSPEL
jgi:CheY-like chemotaxis protein